MHTGHITPGEEGGDHWCLLGRILDHYPDQHGDVHKSLAKGGEIDLLGETGVCWCDEEDGRIGYHQVQGCDSSSV